MTTDSPSCQTTGPHERLMAAITALTTSVGIAGALVLCFDTASPAQWEVPTPGLLAQLARCEQQRLRNGQDECRRQVATAARAQSQAIRLAGR
jgi:hypothetical protein